MLRFCPKDANCLVLNAKDTGLTRKCPTCDYQEVVNPKTKEDALVLETTFRSGSSASGAASGITVNAYTLYDPTLPHMKTLPCPNGACPSRTDESKRDIIYIKTDPVNMKFQYICTVCKQQWTN